MYHAASKRENEKITTKNKFQNVSKQSEYNVYNALIV